MFFAFGIAFEVPIATILLTVTGITTPDKLVKKRPYIIVGAFVVGMLLTPPDIVSQTLLAIPVWLLFELGVIFSRIILRNKDANENNEKKTKDDANKKPAKDTNQDPDLDDQITDEEMERILDEAEASENADKNNGP
jgi:sec-independent protein translocase protein TatC